jgi:hypothetical protein
MAQVVEQKPAPVAGHGADQLDLLEDGPLWGKFQVQQPLHHLVLPPPSFSWSGELSFFLGHLEGWPAREEWEIKDVSRWL